MEIAQNRLSIFMLHVMSLLVEIFVMMYFVVSIR